MPKFTIYVSQRIELEGEITIEADSVEHAYEIESELLAEDFNLQQTDSVFTVLEVIEVE